MHIVRSYIHLEPARRTPVSQPMEVERFYAAVKTPIVVFDEVHQLPDPSRLLKVAANEFPHLKILATGSSTLAAFRALHPQGDNFVITPQVEPPYPRDMAGLPIVFCNLEHWETGETHRVVVPRLSAPERRGG